MAQEYYRFKLDLAIPRSVWESLTQTQRDAWMDNVRKIKLLAQKINVGTIKEEDTTIAKWHLCQHELGLSCSVDGDV